MPDRERMSSVDTAWLRMDRTTNRMVIVGILLFDTPVDYERLKATIEARLLRFDRFRRRPVLDGGGAWWVDTPKFDVAKHIRRVHLPGKGGPEGLRRYVAKLIPKPFDPRRPWWEYTLVEGYNGGTAVIMRIHHRCA
jgi:hypothetical protein